MLEWLLSKRLIWSLIYDEAIKFTIGLLICCLPKAKKLHCVTFLCILMSIYAGNWLNNGTNNPSNPSNWNHPTLQTGDPALHTGTYNPSNPSNWNQQSIQPFKLEPTILQTGTNNPSNWNQLSFKLEPTSPFILEPPVHHMHLPKLS